MWGGGYIVESTPSSSAQLNAAVSRTRSPQLPYGNTHDSVSRQFVGYRLSVSLLRLGVFLTCLSEFFGSAFGPMDTVLITTHYACIR